MTAGITGSKNISDLYQVEQVLLQILRKKTYTEPMDGITITLPIAVALAVGFLIFFLWSVKNGEYEDPEMPAHKMLLDDDQDVDRSMQPADKSKEKSKEKSDKSEH